MNCKTQKIEGSFVVRAVISKGLTADRETFLSRLTHYCQTLSPEASAFQGLSEGMMTAEEAHSKGFETESWVLDAGMAPHERDWLGAETDLPIELYFQNEKAAQLAVKWIQGNVNLHLDPTIEFQPSQDWNAEWKKSFQGIVVDDGLKIVPPWDENWVAGKREGLVAINPGAGFGTGTHETTQLCLQLIRKQKNLHGKRILDFGSGSGILGITAATLGADVICVEIDPLANENAAENAVINGVQDRVQITTEVNSDLNGTVDIVVANILRPILLQFSDVLFKTMKPHFELILSGLIESDLPEVIDHYQRRSRALGLNLTIDRLEKGEWRAIYLRT